jgi:hypothetical protein
LLYGDGASPGRNAVTNVRHLGILTGSREPGAGNRPPIPKKVVFSA